jgi:hypothetical protein
LPQRPSVFSLQPIYLRSCSAYSLTSPELKKTLTRTAKKSAFWVVAVKVMP